MTGGLYNPRPVDDVPVNGQVQHGVTSNWAFDHAADYGLHTVFICKTADQIVHDSIVLVNDTHLLYAIGANEVWRFVAALLHRANPAADIDITFTIPVGGNLNWGLTPVQQGSIAGTEVRIPTSAGANLRLDFIHGIIRNGATPGNLQLQWAQGTQQNDDAIMAQYSCLVLQQIA